MTLKSNFSLLNADYVKLNKNWNYQNVISPFYRLYLIDQGEGSVFNASKEYTLESGYLYLIPSFTICNHVCTNYLNQYYLHFIEESADGTSLFDSNRKIFKIPAIDTDYILFQRILKLNPNRGLQSSDNPKEYEKQPILKGFQEKNLLLPLSAYVETQGILLQFLARFLGLENYQPTNAANIPSKILQTIHYIQTHLQLPLTVEYLAEQVSLNSDYFSRLFYQYTGERPLPYIQQKRIERAQFLLITTDFPFSEIAAETGFETVPYFYRIFKKITYQTPGEYKANHQF
ncbi:AraC family transcriptional regulator [Xanthocytophaga flavus]|uniref:AraC family transcriptional regulator n=1 Tax=Xanthocytophaga flava TaxID=3048013 RepID=UPI0028D2B9EE|nr:AraC family transcriptional regulator [Xanthocytophaga flavus]